MNKPLPGQAPVRMDGKTFGELIRTMIPQPQWVLSPINNHIEPIEDET